MSFELLGFVDTSGHFTDKISIFHVQIRVEYEVVFESDLTCLLNQRFIAIHGLDLGSPSEKTYFWEAKSAVELQS